MLLCDAEHMSTASEALQLLDSKHRPVITRMDDPAYKPAASPSPANSSSTDAIAAAATYDDLVAQADANEELRLPQSLRLGVNMTR